jgi:hypothetical protein
VILRGKHSHDIFAVGQREHRQLLARHELLDEHLGARISENAIAKHHLYRALGLLGALSDYDSFACGESRCFDDNRGAVVANRLLCSIDVRVESGSRSWNASGRHQRFGKCFRRFNARRGLRWAEDLSVVLREEVDDPRL